MSEVFAVFTTGTAAADRPALFGLWASSGEAEAAAAALRLHLQDESCAAYPGEPLYSQVSVSYVPVR